MIKTPAFISALTGVLLLTAGCAGQTAPGDESGAPAASETPGASADPELSKALLLGDSIAAGQALPLTAAFEAAGVGFESIASDGGGNVVGPFSEKNWKELPDQISAAAPDVVVYQITTYDWGTREEQRAGYEKLLNTVTGSGAELVFVTMPPIRPDDFYRPHMAELEHAPEAARVVAKSSEQARLLDAQAVWGDTYQQVRDGTADRSSDGIHTCPQGAARFADWLVEELARSYSGFEPAAPDEWANSGWAADKHFKGC